MAKNTNGAIVDNSVRNVEVTLNKSMTKIIYRFDDGFLLTQDFINKTGDLNGNKNVFFLVDIFILTQL